MKLAQTKLALIVFVSCLAGGIPLLGADAFPQLLARGQGKGVPRQPQVFVSPNGVVDLVYTAGDEIFVCMSADQGRSFARTAASIRCPNISSGMRRGPRVVRTGETLIVTAIGGEQGGGRDGDLFSWRSTDNGKTWSPPTKVNDVAGSAREGLHGMAAASSGALWCVWLDLRNGRSEIYTATSVDSGVTWNANVRAYQSPSGSVCECCHPSVVAGQNDGVRIMFRNSLNGDRDMYLVTANNGRDFDGGLKLGDKGWRLDACPMDGGMLASDGQDRLVTVWQRDDHVYATFGDKLAEISLGPGRQPWTAWSAGGPVLTWTQGKEGPLFLQLGMIGKPRTIATVARFPVAASNPKCEFSIVAWESKEGDGSAVYALAIPTPGTSVNTNN
jgi:hypothetical protein